jgi:hypothetical protein
VHGGTAQTATDLEITLDEFVQEKGVTRLDLIKIDTDGYELDVLKGASGVLKKFHPIVLFELTTYLLEERGIKFSQYEDLLLPLGYRLLDSRSGRPVSSASLSQVPKGGGIDVAAIPKA